MTAKDMNRPATCQVPGCEGTYRICMHQATGVYACSSCRIRYRKHGQLGPLAPTSNPTTCQVPGCDNTARVGLHRATGVYACKKCRNRYSSSGQLEPQTPTTKPITCQVDGCTSTNEIRLHRATGVHACRACRLQYGRRGTFVRKAHRKPRIKVPVCQVCRTRESKYCGRIRHLPQKWRCERCIAFAYQTGRERPMYTKYTRDRVCTNCGRNTEHQKSFHLCALCYSYRRRNGHLPSPEHIAKYAPHGWCECGKPATKQVDLRTGALYVHPTLTGSSDNIRAEVQEWAEWMCDECAGLEDEMQNIDTSDHTPTSMIRRA